MWSKKVPAKPGVYWTADLQGNLCRPRHVIAYGGYRGRVVSVASLMGREWGGLWWTVPIVEPPAPSLASLEPETKTYVLTKPRKY